MKLVNTLLALAEVLLNVFFAFGIFFLCVTTLIIVAYKTQSCLLGVHDFQWYWGETSCTYKCCKCGKWFGECL